MEIQPHHNKECKWIFFNPQRQDIEFVDLGNNEVDIAIINTSVDDLMQRLYLRFKTFKRDLMWNTGYGIDYLNDVFGINKSQIVVDTIVKEEIRKEPMVASITFFESQLVKYTYACKFSVYLKEEQKTVTYYILTNENGLDITNENGDVLTLKL